MINRTRGTRGQGDAEEKTKVRGKEDRKVRF